MVKEGVDRRKDERQRAYAASMTDLVDLIDAQTRPVRRLVFRDVDLADEGAEGINTSDCNASRTCCRRG